MAYPPYIPPATRTNSTAMASNHPNDHNQLADALNDIINELGNDPSGPSGNLQFRVHALEVHKLDRDGSLAMSGDLDMGGHVINNLQDFPPGPNSAVPKQWLDENFVNSDGDTMDGPLVVGGTPGPATGAVGTTLDEEGFVGSTAGNARVGSANVMLKRVGGDGAQANNEPFVTFRREAAGTGSAEIIGQIIIKTGSTVSYETSSDYRLKENLGPITDAAARIQQIAPLTFRGRFIADEGAGDEWDMVAAHDLAAVVPYAVRGTKDAVDPDGNPVYQTVDYSNLVVLLVSALGDALTRIEALEAKPGP